MGSGLGSQCSKPLMPKRWMPTGRFNFGVRDYSICDGDAADPALARDRGDITAWSTRRVASQ